MSGARLAELSAFFPAHDEEANVAAVATDLLAVLPGLAERFELIIVNDGSRDATGAIADGIAARHPEVRVVHHPVNRGYGAAVRSGLGAARYEWVFFTDGDRQFDVREIRRLIDAVDGADVVVGYRARRADPFMRRANSRGWNLLVRSLFRLPVRDVNCAFKLFRRRALAGLDLQAEGAMVSAELLAKLVHRGHRIVEVPVTHLPRTQGTPTGANPKVIVRAFRELAHLAQTLRARGSAVAR